MRRYLTSLKSSSQDAWGEDLLDHGIALYAAGHIDGARRGGGGAEADPEASVTKAWYRGS